MASRRVPRRTAHCAGAGPAARGPALGGRAPPAGRPPRGASIGGAVSTPHTLATAAEAKDAGGSGPLAAGRSGGAVGAGRVGRPALGRPVHPGGARAAPGPRPHDPPAAGADRQTGVSPTLGALVLYDLLTLTRLMRHQSEAMVLRVTGGKPLPAEVLAQVVAKTDGIPLFVDELVKTILE